ncbi:MAG: hypothetical protein AAF385_12555 [Pseudomonadota bacterium]
MNKQIISGLVASALLGIGNVAAACDYPEKADIPNGATATEAEMIAGQKTVKRFMAQMDDYLACIDAENAEAAVEGEAEEITAQREAFAVKKHNAAVDDLERVAAEFNEQVRAFKNK